MSLWVIGAGCPKDLLKPLPTQRLAKDKFVGDSPGFVRDVFRNLTGLRKVNIVEGVLR